MSKYNGVLSIERYGERRVTVTTIDYGVGLQTSPVAHSRRGRNFFTIRRKSGSFEIGIVFTSHAEYESMMNWLKEYLFRTTIRESDVYPVRVIVPSRGFDMSGTLNGGLTYGDRVGQFTYKVTLSFGTGRDRLALNTGNNISEFNLPSAEDPALPYLYPAGSQLSGMMMGKDAILDTSEFDELPDIDTESTRTKRRPRGRSAG